MEVVLLLFLYCILFCFFFTTCTLCWCRGKKNIWNNNICSALDRKSDCTSIINTCDILKRDSVGFFYTIKVKFKDTIILPCIWLHGRIIVSLNFTFIVFLFVYRNAFKGHFILKQAVTVDHKSDRGLPTHTPTEQRQHFPSIVATGFHIS